MYDGSAPLASQLDPHVQELATFRYGLHEDHVSVLSSEEAYRLVFEALQVALPGK